MMQRPHRVPFVGHRQPLPEGSVAWYDSESKITLCNIIRQGWVGTPSHKRLCFLTGLAAHSLDFDEIHWFDSCLYIFRIMSQSFGRGIIRPSTCTGRRRTGANLAVMNHAGLGVEQLLQPGLPTDDEQHRLLDAARAEFVEHGFRRTSVGDIARRAKVSRPTIYRRLGDKDDIVRQVVIRDVVAFFISISAQVLTKPTPEEKAIEAFVLGVRECRRHPLVAALQQFEPETLTSFLTDDVSTLEPVRAAIAMTIASETYPLDAALRAAEMFIRITASLLMLPSELLPIDTDEHARWFARTYFPPIFAASTASPD